MQIFQTDFHKVSPSGLSKLRPIQNEGSIYTSQPEGQVVDSTSIQGKSFNSGITLKYACVKPVLGVLWQFVLYQALNKQMSAEELRGQELATIP